MCVFAAVPMILMAVSAAVTAYSQVSAGNAEKASDNYQAKVADQNATVARLQATNALADGTQAEEMARLRTRALMGAQQAAFGANNVEGGSGSSLDLAGDTAAAGQQDQLTIRGNAARQAWGYNVEADNYDANAALKRAAGKNAQFQGILSAGSTVFGAAAKAFGGMGGGMGAMSGGGSGSGGGP